MAIDEARDGGKRDVRIRMGSRRESKGQVGRVQVGGASTPVGFAVARSGIACSGARAVVLYSSMCMNLVFLVLHVDLGYLEHEWSRIHEILFVLLRDLAFCWAQTIRLMGGDWSRDI
jgi:hypothetical protein